MLSLINSALVIIGVFDIVSLSPKFNWIINCDPLAYTNPIVIISSVFLFLAFSKIELKSRIVNIIASSSLAAYLFHLHPAIFPTYSQQVLSIYNKNDGIFCIIFLLCYIILFFLISIIIDKIREAIWNVIIQKHNG